MESQIPIGFNPYFIKARALGGGRVVVEFMQKGFDFVDKTMTSDVKITEFVYEEVGDEKIPISSYKDALYFSTNGKWGVLYKDGENWKAFLSGAELYDPQNDDDDIDNIDVEEEVDGGIKIIGKIMDDENKKSDIIWFDRTGKVNCLKAKWVQDTAEQICKLCVKDTNEASPEINKQVLDMCVRCHSTSGIKYLEGLALSKTCDAFKFKGNNEDGNPQFGLEDKDGKEVSELKIEKKKDSFQGCSITVEEIDYKDYFDFSGKWYESAISIATGTGSVVWKSFDKIKDLFSSVTKIVGTVFLPKFDDDFTPAMKLGEGNGVCMMNVYFKNIFKLKDPKNNLSTHEYLKRLMKKCGSGLFMKGFIVMPNVNKDEVDENVGNWLGLSNMSLKGICEMRDVKGSIGKGIVDKICDEGALKSFDDVSVTLLMIKSMILYIADMLFGVLILVSSLGYCFKLLNKE